ncbi:MAG: enoyl-CoA hydratase/isomerase family protein [Bacteriovoracaceae bacterium]|nr:enoyl-CoA hydratase/isomerase family protein [Bacteriovoracaceae bacterium]
MFETIKYTTQSSTAIITLNRPEVYNALNVQGKLDIIAGLAKANSDKEIRSIILTAEGKAFCSGQDLNDRSVDARKGPVDIGHTLETEWNPLVEAIRNSEKPVIAAINGVCAGAGLSVALACDLKIAAPQIRFIAGFTQIGLAPDAGLSTQLVKNMGYTKAYAFALKGKPLLSEEMLDLGFINEIDTSPLDKALALALEINSLPPLSVAATKKNFQAAQEKSWNEILEIEKHAQRKLGFSADYKEGVTAFLEKRKPTFRGE